MLHGAEHLDEVRRLVGDEDVLGPAPRVQGERVVDFCARTSQVSSAGEGGESEMRADRCRKEAGALRYTLVSEGTGNAEKLLAYF